MAFLEDIYIYIFFLVGDPYDKKGTVGCRFHFNKAVPHFLGWQLVSLKQKMISKSSSQFDPTIEP